MDFDPAPADKPMRLRYAGTWRVCASAVPAKSEAIYERDTKTVRCLTRSPTATPVATEASARTEQVPLATTAPDVAASEAEGIDAGTPGASARREFERRQTKRVNRIRSNHPKLGGIILALSDDPQSTRAWDAGAIGEERLGNRLNELVGENVRMLHDRRIPGGRSNVDTSRSLRTGSR